MMCLAARDVSVHSLRGRRASAARGAVGVRAVVRATALRAAGAEELAGRTRPGTVGRRGADASPSSGAWVDVLARGRMTALTREMCFSHTYQTEYLVCDALIRQV